MTEQISGTEKQAIGTGQYDDFANWMYGLVAFRLMGGIN